MPHIVLSIVIYIGLPPGLNPMYLWNAYHTSSYKTPKRNSKKRSLDTKISAAHWQYWNQTTTIIIQIKIIFSEQCTYKPKHGGNSFQLQNQFIQTIHWVNSNTLTSRNRTICCPCVVWTVYYTLVLTSLYLVSGQGVND